MEAEISPLEAAPSREVLIASRRMWRGRAVRAEAVISSVHAALDEARGIVARFRSSHNPDCECEWDRGAMSVVESVAAVLDSSGTPGPIESSREQARAEVELVQRWWLRDAQGWRYRMAGPQAAQEAKARGLAGAPPEELTVCWDFEFRPSSSRMFDAPPFPGDSSETVEDAPEGT